MDILISCEENGVVQLLPGSLDDMRKELHSDPKRSNSKSILESL